MKSSPLFVLALGFVAGLAALTLSLVGGASILLAILAYSAAGSLGVVVGGVILWKLAELREAAEQLDDGFALA